jgi:hypothetical protein
VSALGIRFPDCLLGKSLEICILQLFIKPSRRTIIKLANLGRSRVNPT